MMKQRWGLDINVLRPTPGDPWGVEQHHWNTGAEENQQLNPGGPSNRQKSSGPNQLKYIALCRGHHCTHICLYAFVCTCVWSSDATLHCHKRIWQRASQLMHIFSCLHISVVVLKRGAWKMKNIHYKGWGLPHRRQSILMIEKEMEIIFVTPHYGFINESLTPHLG